jgi:prepilin-type N-terminal cleavage/methylation domain-containing protein
VRRAFTLVELVVAIAIGGVAFGAFTAVVAQQERTHSRLAYRIRARAQALEGLAPLVRELRAVSSGSGDIVAAHDSAIEFRATVATLSVCEVREAAVLTALASLVSAPKVGDTLWALMPDDSVPWLPLPLASVAMAPASDSATCVAPPTAPGASPRGLSSRHRYLLGVAEPPPASMRVGTPLQVTRRVRYSLYRAPDSHWYLGRREWSPVLGRFETIQPIGGPYRAHAAVGGDLSGLELRYLDSADEAIDPASPGPERISRIDVTVRTRPPPSDDTIRRRRDVTSATVAPRNRT